MMCELLLSILITYLYCLDNRVTSRTCASSTDYLGQLILNCKQFSWWFSSFHLSYIIYWFVAYTVNQKVCSSHQIKRESLVTIVTPKYGVMCTPHRLGVKCTPNLV